MSLIFDTSVLIDNLRGGTFLQKVLQSLEKKKTLLLPSIVLMEIFSGTSTRKKEIILKVKKLTELFEKIELDEIISTRAGILVRDLEMTLEVPDYIIAATALELGASIVTLNKKHFEKIPGISIYPL